MSLRLGDEETGRSEEVEGKPGRTPGGNDGASLYVVPFVLQRQNQRLAQ